MDERLDSTDELELGYAPLRHVPGAPLNRLSPSFYRADSVFKPGGGSCTGGYPPLTHAPYPHMIGCDGAPFWWVLALL